MIGGLLVGGGLAAFVMIGPDIEGTWVLGALLALSLLFPVWRGETVLGFLTGAMVGVGAMLPSIFAFVFAAISFAVHRGLVPGLKHLRRQWATR